MDVSELLGIALGANWNWNDNVEHRPTFTEGESSGSSLPPELYEAIFNQVSDDLALEDPPPSEYDPHVWRSRAHILCSAALVCKAWAAPAIRVLYKDVHLSSLHALYTFHRTLSESEDHCGMVRTIIFASSLFANPIGPRDLDSKSSAEPIEQEVKRMIKLLRELHTALRGVKIELTWPRKSTPGLRIYADQIVSLHIIAKRPFVSTYDWHALAFPVLTNLTLTGVDCAAEAVCPIFLRLEYLRLERCSIFNPFKEDGSSSAPPCPYLRTVELMNLWDTEPEVIASLLNRCASAIETLWIVEAPWSRDGYNRIRLDTLVRLRCLGTTCVPSPAYLPESLQCLKVVDSGNEQLSFEDVISFSNPDALERLLLPEQCVKYPLLSRVEVIDTEESWGPYEHFIRARCEELHIQFVLKLRNQISASRLQRARDVRPYVPPPVGIEEPSTISGIVMGFLRYFARPHW